MPLRQFIASSGPVQRKYAILAGYKIVMNQRSVCTRFINPCHSGFALMSRSSPSCLGLLPRVSGFALVSRASPSCLGLRPRVSGFALVSRASPSCLGLRPRVSGFINPIQTSHMVYNYYNYSVTKILRKIRATTFTENYGKLRVRGMSAWDERTLLPISLDNAILYRSLPARIQRLTRHKPLKLFFFLFTRSKPL